MATNKKLYIRLYRRKNIRTWKGDINNSPLLIAKLRAYGFSDEALGLMRSYFC